jgi:glycine cleavage system regulatory protein
VGVPPVAPIAGETYSLAVIFKRTAERLPTPLVDAIWVNWKVTNGPNATVSVQDTYSYSGMTLADLQSRDTLQNDWSVTDWRSLEPYTCQKVKSGGCDILTARVERPWH